MKGTASLYSTDTSAGELTIVSRGPLPVIETYGFPGSGQPTSPKADLGCRRSGSPRK